VALLVSFFFFVKWLCVFYKKTPKREKEESKTQHLQHLLSALQIKDLLFHGLMQKDIFALGHGTRDL
jgi:hypothetical protein